MSFIDYMDRFVDWAKNTYDNGGFEVGPILLGEEPAYVPMTERLSKFMDDVRLPDDIETIRGRNSAKALNAERRDLSRGLELDSELWSLTK
ncbi:hypothetical protein K8R33_00080 [archaeon]|nr:hypothetical protein [archaeon]